MYGVVKLTGYQAPRAHLSTPADDIAPNKLVWYFLGRERPYIWFLGAVELSAGLLSLWRRTRIVGSAACLMLAIHITAMDFAFGLLPVAYAALTLAMLAAIAVLGDWPVVRPVLWAERLDSSTTDSSDSTTNPQPRG